ncbi:MAG: TPM domain-containing protein, partial [Candidatus Cloacimonetes bacterium]|nr:TPM domain-containing protein [Candidatus Cloacimonadota bacterium]
MRKKFIALLLLLVLVSWLLSEEKLPELRHRVNDQSNILSSNERSQLETNLEQFERKSAVQIAVLIIPTTGERAIEEYSIKLAEKWKIGHKNYDNGLI